MSSSEGPDWLVTCDECGVARDRSNGRSPCPVCDGGMTSALATDGGVDVDEDRATRQVTVPSEDVAVIAMRDDGDLYENVEGGVFVTTGDYDDPSVDIDTFRTRVDTLRNRMFERDDGSVWQLLGDFNGFAVYREADSQADAAERARVFMVEWSRFVDEFHLIGTQESVGDRLSED